MISMGKSMILKGIAENDEDVIKGLEAVTKEEVDDMIDKIFASDKIGICAVGKNAERVKFA